MKLKETKLIKTFDDNIIKFVINGKTVLSISRYGECIENSGTADNNEHTQGDDACKFFIRTFSDKLYVCCKTKQYETFQYYACYQSKTDFFDLYNVLRDYMSHHNNSLRLNIALKKTRDIGKPTKGNRSNLYSKET
jgi:hypothetical protein